MYPRTITFARRLSRAGLAASLVLALAGTGLASAAPRNSFSGDFELLSDDGQIVLGRVTATLTDPSSLRLVPGTYDFKGAAGNGIRESHAQLGHVGWWFDPNNPEPGVGGSNVAFADGVECLYFGPGDALCHEFAVMFIDDLNPTFLDQVAFADHRNQAGEWDFTYWFKVGKGDFTLKLADS